MIQTAQEAHQDAQHLFDDPEAREALVRPQPHFPRVPGYNVDPVDVGAGLALLEKFGYDDSRTRMVIEYALQRWARGEEVAAERSAIDKAFHGVDYTTWRAVLAAAVAKGTADLEAKKARAS